MSKLILWVIIRRLRLGWPHYENVSPKLVIVVCPIIQLTPVAYEIVATSNLEARPKTSAQLEDIRIGASFCTEVGRHTAG